MKKSLIDKLYAAGMIQLDGPNDPPGSTPPAPIPTPPAYPPTPPAPGATFTQEDLNRIAAAEHAKGERRGKDAAAAEVAQSLGVDIDEAKRIIQSHKDAENQALTQAQRDAQAAAQEREAAAKERLEAKNDRHAARVERALSTAGVPQNAINAINVPGITADSSAEEVVAAVEKLKTDVPSLFTGTAPTPPPHGDPGRPPTGGLGTPPTGSLGGEGIKRFEQRYPKKS